MKEKRDSLDFGEMRVSRLFRKLFFPTLLGLISSVLLNLADGIFVGRGVGSDALAAINIAAPLFQISTGIALMFGSGLSVVAAIHLGKGNTKAANINVTQAFTVGLLLMTLCVIAINIFPRQTASLCGGNDTLYPMVLDYIRGVSPSLLFLVINIVGLFAIRLDGSPNYAMAVNAVAAMLNIFLDWLFVFPLQWGLFGAGVATSIASGAGSLMVVWYFTRRSSRIRLYRPKFTGTAIGLTARNCGYMLRLGFPTFLAETAISCMMITGNYMFMDYLHEDGVAAFSIACYLFPMIFMFGNAIAQSSLPIVSYNYGLGRTRRVRSALRISAGLAVALGLVMSLVGFFFTPQIVDMFLDPSARSWAIGVHGIPLFMTTCLPFTLNVVLIGYLQSLERYKPATAFMLLRGFVVIIPCFILVPTAIGTDGLWLAEPLSETITLVALLTFILVKRLRRHVVNLLLVAVLLLGAACSSQADSQADNGYWSDSSSWYQSKDTVSPDKIDLLYIVSTDVVTATDSDGDTVYTAQLTTADRKAMDGEFAYVEKNIGQGDFNYFAPYYHQFTFDAISLPTSQFDSIYTTVSKEICAAFDHYMRHWNQGRKYALVGFSQGGMLVLDLLKHMSDGEYNRMVAAYVMGYRISADDLQCKHIVPATDEDSPGVTVSFNSVLDNSGIWPFVSEGAVAAINPVNWKTDATPATFVYGGSGHTAHMDTVTHQIIVETDKAEEYREWNGNPVFQSANVSPDCLHHWDLLFYTGFIHDNIQRRAANR